MNDTTSVGARRFRLVGSAAVLLSAALAGCVVAPLPRPYYGGPPAPVYGPGPGPAYGGEGEVVGVAPPPPQYEVIGVAPFVGAVWIGGYWGWSGGRHVWVPGRWDHGRPGYRYVPHRWEQSGRGWHQQPGHWQRG